jgi:hypothetical protein
LAEYLAADHLIRRCSDDSVRWQTWLADFAEEVAETGARNMSGFTSALRESLAAHGRELGVPPDMPAKIEALLSRPTELRGAALTT